MYDVAYIDNLSVEAVADTVLLGIATGWSLIPWRDVKVYVDTQPSADDSLRFSIHMIGRAHDSAAQGVIEHWWRGDTLVVWCSEYAPNPWDRDGTFEKTTPENPWFAADRVDVAIPDGLQFRYVGRMWPRHK